MVISFQEKFVCKNLHVIVALVLTISSTLKISAQNQNPATALETVNSFPGQWCCVNDGYLYGDGLNTRAFIFRKRENGQAIERRADVTSLNPSFQIENRMYGTSIPGLIFILVKDNQDEHFLLKSSDGGATIKNVFAFGQGNGPGNTNTSNVRMLKGLLELGRDVPSGGGKGTLYIGEYNFNSKRIPGSINDRVRIMKSTDNGDTWTKVVEWNTNGASQVGHIHSIVQDPYTGEIYICTGDFGTDLGIIKWDGISEWTDNRTLPQISTMKGFKVFTGLQRYRTCDILFDENYFYTFADTQGINNPVGTESGIWRARKDFSSYTRVDNQIYSYDPMHIGWLGGKIGNTFIFTTAREYIDPSNAWKQLNTQVYTSTDGEHWSVSGVLGWRDFDNPALNKYPANIFAYNNKFYIDCYGGAGHSSTIQCVVNPNWDPQDGPVVLHPVYFLGKWNANGNDSNSGTNADLPKASLGNLMTGSRISQGSRIKISSGTFTVSGIDADWTVPVFKGRGSVVIEGRGMDSTKISGTGLVRSGLRIDSAKTSTSSTIPFILKDLEFGVDSVYGSDHRNYVIDITGTYVRSVRCRIGNDQNDDSPLIHLKSPRARYVSLNSIHNAGKKTGIFRTILTADTVSSFSFTNCLIMNAYNAFLINHKNISVNIRFSTFYSIQNSAVITGTASNLQPYIMDCLFSCGSAPIDDRSGIIENQIDYNFYNKANINVTEGVHSPVTGKDPLFVDPAKGDFRVYADSPCANDGLFLADVTTDFTGKTRHNPPSIGAFECIDQNAPSNGTGNGNGSGNNTGNDTINTGNGTGGNNGNGNPTGIYNILTSQVKIYPNPVTDYLTIEAIGENLVSIIVIDINGKLYLKENAPSQMFTLDFTRYQKGMYIIEIITSSNTRKVKIIKD